MQSADLILEILNEEIPSRMQAQGAESFKNAFVKKLEAFGLKTENAIYHYTARRIVLHIKGIPVLQEDRSEELRGPRVGSPDQAINGFLASSGLNSLGQCEQRSTPKGDFWFTTKQIQGIQTKKILPKIIEEVIKELTWPKSMRWGRNTLTWVRPIRSIFCLFNNEPVNGQLDLGYDVIKFSSSTVGHRFMSPEVLTPDSYSSYRQMLFDHFVLLDQVSRREKINESIQTLAAKHRLQVRADSGLLDEVTGLVEWPVALLGKIDPAFMNLPEEVLITSMRVHQRFFALEDSQGKLAPYFILITNIEPKDDGIAIIQGNERVLRARLSDAKFFFEQDKSKNLEEIGKGLTHAIFQEDLGTMAQKVERLKDISLFLARHLHSDETMAIRAAELSKTDLMSQMVGEFPELQGIMGYYYALHQKENPIVALALADQYGPKGFADELSSSDIGRILSLADKIDTIVGYFSIGIRPTGSKDPYALRRSSIGCIRLMETMGDLRLEDLITATYKAYAPIYAQKKATVTPIAELITDIRVFFFDRLKAYWKEKGVRHDYLDAVFSVAAQDSFKVISLRLVALNAFLKREDGMGEKLLTAYRRASNMVRIEEKKDNRTYDEPVNENHLKDEAEKILHSSLTSSREEIEADIKTHEFQKVMAVLAHLSPQIDEFFNAVTVNVAPSEVRVNRLRLLSLIQNTLHQVADFSKIEG